MSSAVLPHHLADGSGRSETWRWTGAFAVVALLHAMALVGILSWRQTVEMSAPPPAAVMIDLAPLPTAPSPDEILTELPLPEPAPVELPDPVSDLEIDLAEPAPVDLPEPVTELALELPKPPPIALPEQVSELAIELPEMAELDLPEPSRAVAPPPPPAKPRPPRPRTRRPPTPEKPVRQEAVPAEQPPQQAPPQPTKSATAAAPPAASNNQQALQPLSKAPPSWQGAVLGRFQRAIRYPRMAQARRKEGVVSIVFRIDRGGHVLAVRLADSSGTELLDEEALAMVKRVSPLPAPPPEMMVADELSVAAPISFNLR